MRKGSVVLALFILTQLFSTGYSLNNVDMWNLYAQSILDNVVSQRADNTMVHIAPQGYQVSLATRDEKVNNYAIYGLADPIPQRSRIYTPGSSFCDMYGSFLEAIQPPSNQNKADVQMKLGTARKELATAQKKFDEESAAGLKSYQEYQESAKITGDAVLPYKTWQMRYRTTLISAQQRLMASQTEINRLNAELFGVDWGNIADAKNQIAFIGGARDSTASNAFNMAINSNAASLNTDISDETLAEDKVDNNAPPTYKPHYAIPSFRSTYSTWQGKATQSGAAPGLVVNVDMKQTVRDSSAYGINQESGGFAGVPFFGVIGGSSSTRTGLVDVYDSEDIKITISYSDYGTFPINEPIWSKTALVVAYQNNLSPLAPQELKDFPLTRVHSVVLGYKPTVKVSFSEKFASKIRTASLSASFKGFSIGPFVFGGQSSVSASASSRQRFEDDFKSFSFSSNSPNPVLLAVLSTPITGTVKKLGFGASLGGVPGALSSPSRFDIQNGFKVHRGSVNMEITESTIRVVKSPDAIVSGQLVISGQSGDERVGGQHAAISSGAAELYQEYFQKFGKASRCGPFDYDNCGLSPVEIGESKSSAYVNTLIDQLESECKRLGAQLEKNVRWDGTGDDEEYRCVGHDGSYWVYHAANIAGNPHEGYSVRKYRKNFS